MEFLLSDTSKKARNRVSLCAAKAEGSFITILYKAKETLTLTMMSVVSDALTKQEWVSPHWTRLQSYKAKNVVPRICGLVSRVASPFHYPVTSQLYTTPWLGITALLSRGCDTLLSPMFLSSMSPKMIPL